MAHHIDAGVHHRADRGSHVRAALQLHAVAQGLLGDPVGCLNGLLLADVVGAKRHISDDEGVRSALDHRADVVDHVVHRHRHRRVVAQHNHAQGVAHQDDLAVTLVDNASGGVVVGRYEGELAALVLVLLEIQNCHLFLVAHCKAPLSSIFESHPTEPAAWYDHFDTFYHTQSLLKSQAIFLNFHGALRRQRIG